MSTMTNTEAAAVLNVTRRHVCWLIRHERLAAIDGRPISASVYGYLQSYRKPGRKPKEEKTATGKATQAVSSTSGSRRLHVETPKTIRPPVWVVSKVVPTQSALVSNSQRRIVEISAHQRW